MELVIGSVDVGTCAVHSEDTVGIACRPTDCRGTHIGVKPWSRERIVCWNRDFNVIKGYSAGLPDVMRSHEQPDCGGVGHGDARRTDLCPCVSVRGFPRSEGIADSLQLEPFVGGAVASEVRGRLRTSEIVLHTHAVADGWRDRREWTAAAICCSPPPLDILWARAHNWWGRRLHGRRVRPCWL